MTHEMLPARELRSRLRQLFAWRGDRSDYSYLADAAGWWRDPQVLTSLGPALAAEFRQHEPTVIIGPESSGCLLGPLVARHLGLGFVAVEKDPTRMADSYRLWQRTTKPDYGDRHLSLGFRRDLVSSTDRVLLVDDWIATGAQALACQGLVADAGATWVGISVIVDGLQHPSLRRPLALRSLLHIREL